MRISYWQSKWDNNDIAFHQTDYHPFLMQYFERIPLSQDARVFLPLCGKTKDFLWLLAQGYSVVGAELIEDAIVQFFDELKIVPKITPLNDLKRYQAENIDIFVGDIFALTPELLGQIDGIFDRAALVALPQEVRPQYCQQLSSLSEKAPQLLVTFEYPQDKLAGPPFAVHADEVMTHYQGDYHIELLSTRLVPGKLKGQLEALEVAWSLTGK